MLIRNGFVSNSSSSSFIIFLAKDFVVTEENIKKLLFGDIEQLEYMYNFDEIKYLETDVLSRWVYSSISQSLQETTDEDVLHELTEYLMTTKPEYDYWSLDRNLPHNEMWAVYEDMRKKARIEAEQNYEKLKAEHSGCNPIVISFSDNDGSYGSQLEHSGIIEEKFNALRISHH